MAFFDSPCINFYRYIDKLEGQILQHNDAATRPDKKRLTICRLVPIFELIKAVEVEQKNGDFNNLCEKFRFVHPDKNVGLF